MTDIDTTGDGASTYKMGHWSPSGKPEADWSRFMSYTADLFMESLTADAVTEAVTDPQHTPFALEQTLLAKMSKVRGWDELPEKEQNLVKSLTQKAGIDISYWPGGENYRVSVASSSNPLGLAGDLWGAVTAPEEGALVAALVESDVDGNLSIMTPGGRGWEPMYDLGVVEDYSFVGLMPEAEEVYKNYDRENTLGVVGSYPLSPDGPYATQEQLEVPMPKDFPPPRTEDDEYWENSGETYDGEPEGVDLSGAEVEDADAEAITASVVINTADDVPDAIAAAIRDQELRWYIERRCAALGIQASFPWQAG
jgi:hypothetical protein